MAHPPTSVRSSTGYGWSYVRAVTKNEHGLHRPAVTFINAQWYMGRKCIPLKAQEGATLISFQHTTVLTQTKHGNRPYYADSNGMPDIMADDKCHHSDPWKSEGLVMQQYGISNIRPFQYPDWMRSEKVAASIPLQRVNAAELSPKRTLLRLSMGID